MSYADHFPWLRHGFVRLQGADNVIRKLPACDARRRVLEHIDAAERALQELDRELEENAALEVTP
jgi:hypothetical protein